jgi:transglutaminase-like putative cysteine protease
MNTMARTRPPGGAPAARARYRIVHATRYLYSEAVPLCQNELHVHPRDTPRQTCLTHRLVIDPLPVRVEECRDYFGNHIQFFTIHDRHTELAVTAQTAVELRAAERLLPGSTTNWEEIAAMVGRVLGDDLDVRQFVYDSPHIAAMPTLAALGRESFTPGRPWLEALLDLTSRIHRDFVYDATATSISTPLADVLAIRRGVCQDFAHLQIGCLRSLGLPARYVSGYLLTTPPPGQPRLVGADASHAWVSAWCPEFGWVDFDPTNNVIPSLEHITVAWGRDYSDVCPIKGVFVGGGEHAMNVSVDVEPLFEN